LDDLIRAVATLQPDRAVVGHKHGAAVIGALAAAFADVGLQHIWLRP
jgi:hypothetical protein